MKKLIFSLVVCSLSFLATGSKADANDYTTLRLHGRSLTLNQSVSAIRPYIGMPSRAYLASIADPIERKRIKHELVVGLRTGDVPPGTTEAVPAELLAGQTFVIDKEEWNPFMREVMLYFNDSQKHRFAVTVRVPDTNQITKGSPLTVESIVTAVPVQDFVQRHPNVDTLYVFGAIR